MRDILSEFLRPQSPLWPEVKLFLSICKSAGQRLPMEAQVVNIMNVRRGLKRLSRLRGDEDPFELVGLLQWITDRSEIAGAFCLQRLKIGHQVNWICALLASIARIRQFCQEVLDKILTRNAKRKLADGGDSGIPLDRSSFNKLSKTGDSDLTSASRPATPSGSLWTACTMTRTSGTAGTLTALAATSSTPTTTSSQFANAVRTEAGRPAAVKVLQNDMNHDEQTGNGSSRAAEILRVKNHPRMVNLKAKIKVMIEANTDAAKRASLKKVYGIALKRSLNEPMTEELIKKVCKLALKKARTYCE